LPVFALLLILLAALAHSAWNFLAKRKAEGKNLIWFSSIWESVLFLPVVIQTGFHFRYTLASAACLVGTGVLHLLYTECLLRGYRTGDLSIVYPLARGTGPLLSFAGAILVLRERFSFAGVTGALLVAIGIVTICGGIRALRRRDARSGIFWGSLTGVMIASYTLVDGYAIRDLAVSPFLIEYAGSFLRTFFLALRVKIGSPVLIAEYKQCWKEALGIAILMPIGYILVLFAMRIAPVSHVAPAREMSMMIGAWMGAKLLNEGNVARRVIGSCLIAGGVAALAIG
jgi:drug/metabolite transporter (DMT)-like permease